METGEAVNRFMLYARSIALPLYPARPPLGNHRPGAAAHARGAGRLGYDPASDTEAADGMIPRYSRPEMAKIWSPENRFRIWFEIEAYACDAQAALGVIPESAARAVWERGAFEVERIDEIERETHHEMIAFLTNLAEHVGPEARFVHQGMTSSDVLDTCLAVQLKAGRRHPAGRSRRDCSRR